MGSGQQQTEKSAQRRERHHSQNQTNPLPRIERRIKNERHQQKRDGDDDGQAAIGALLAFVFASPIEVIAFGQLDLLPHLFDCLAHRAAQVAPANAVLDCDVAGIAFAIDRGSTIFQFDLA